MGLKSSANISKQHESLKQNGHILVPIELDSELDHIISEKDYIALDEYFQKETKQNGRVFEALLSFCPVKKIEFIISLREAHNDWEEDGIWHDDGSRILAFSLSLTKEPPTGGKLGFRKKGEKEMTMISTPAYGDMVIFKTGVESYEHKIHAVTKGARLVIAGWCYSSLE